VPLEDVPIIQEAKESKTITTLYVNSDATVASVPVIQRKVERLAEQYNDITRAVVKPKGSRLEITPRIVGTIIQLVKSQRARDAEIREPEWLSIYRDSKKVILSGKIISKSVLRRAFGCRIWIFRKF
jgi:hypothetical protein